MSRPPALLSRPVNLDQLAVAGILARVLARRRQQRPRQLREVHQPLHPRQQLSHRAAVQEQAPRHQQRRLEWWCSSARKRRSRPRVRAHAARACAASRPSSKSRAGSRSPMFPTGRAIQHVALAARIYVAILLHVHRDRATNNGRDVSNPAPRARPPAAARWSRLP